MGSEVVCDVELDGEKSEAKVLLESEEIIVRAPFRLKIPFGSIRKLDADEKQLRVRWDSHTLSISLGRDAKKWVGKIRNPKSLTEKLGIKSGQKISISGTIGKKFIDELQQRGADVGKGVRRDSDIIFVAIERREELDRMVGMIASLASDGALWVIRPRGSNAISEREVMDTARAAGLVDVKVARFSGTHTAEKFVIPKKDRPTLRNRG